MVDTGDLKSPGGNSVTVRVRSPAPKKKAPCKGAFFFGIREQKDAVRHSLASMRFLVYPCTRGDYMKKTFLAFVCMVMLLLSACSKSYDVPYYVKVCWNEISSADDLFDIVCVNKYTSRLNITGEVSDSPMYSEIPERGYAVVFYRIHAEEPFWGSYACFLNEEGELICSYSYEEQDKLFDMYYSKYSIYNIEAGERALEHIGNCNFITTMVNCGRKGEFLQGEPDNNLWYSLSEEDMDWIKKQVK